MASPRSLEPALPEAGPAATPASTGLLLAVVAASGIALGGSTAMPFLLGALMERLSLGAAGAGLLASFELSAVALVSLLVAPRVGRTSRLGLALTGAAIAACGHGASALAETYGPLAAARAVAGVGEGLALAAGSAAVAASPDPDRLYARVAVVAGSAGALLLLALPYVTRPFGFRGGFTLLAVVCLVLAPFLRALPTAPSIDPTSRSTPPNRRLAVATLVALVLLSLGEGSIWAFAERIGMRAGLSAEGVGSALAAATLLGLGGAGLASWLGTRSGRTGPVAAGVLGVAASTFALGYVTTAAAYVGLVLWWSASFFFTLPYLMGTAAALDREGRWIAAAAGLLTVGIALGPGIAGTLVARFGFPALSWLVAGSCAAGLALVLPVTFVLDRAPEAEA